jgi:hypothetical protein
MLAPDQGFDAICALGGYDQIIPIGARPQVLEIRIVQKNRWSPRRGPAILQIIELAV